GLSNYPKCSAAPPKSPPAEKSCSTSEPALPTNEPRSPVTTSSAAACTTSARIHAVIDTLDDIQKQQLLRLLIEDVRVTGRHVQIRLRIALDPPPPDPTGPTSTPPPHPHPVSSQDGLRSVSDDRRGGLPPEFRAAQLLPHHEPAVAISMLFTIAAALTLGPALLTVGSPFGLFDPRRLVTAHLCRRIGASEMLMVESDHDMRNSADFISLDRVAKSLIRLPGVAMVQSITRPLGRPLDMPRFPTRSPH